MLIDCARRRWSMAMVKAPLPQETEAKNHRRFQSLSLQRQDHHSGKPAGLAGGARAQCPCFGEPAPPVPHSLFRLFYLVEIRHRQLLQSQSRTRSAGADAQEITIRIWRLHDYLFVKSRREQRATGNRRTAGLLLSRAVIRSARLLPTQSSSGGALREKAHARITFPARLAGRVQLSRRRRWPRLASPSRSHSRRISHVTCETKKLNSFSGRIMLHNSCRPCGNTVCNGAGLSTSCSCSF